MELIIKANSASDLKAKLKDAYEGLCANTAETREAGVANVIVSTQEQTEPKNVTVLKPFAASNEVAESTAAYIKDEEVELDSEGIVWDQRIHQIGKPKTTKGVWKTKKGLTKEYIATIKLELKPTKDSLKGQLPVGGSTEPVAEAKPNPFVKPTMFSKPTEDIGPSPESLTQSDASFAKNFVEIIANLVKIQTIDASFVQNACAHFGVNDIVSLKSQTEKISELFTVMVQHGILKRLG